MKVPLLFLLSLGLAAFVHAESMRVQVQNGQVRRSPSFMGQVVATIPYGQAVTAQPAQGDWRQIQTTDGKTGWMHTSALTAKRISMQGGGGAISTGASGDELALAGKGFNADVEAKYKTDHANIDFTWVDKMSKMEVSSSKISEFATVGGLKQHGGAQ